MYSWYKSNGCRGCGAGNGSKCGVVTSGLNGSGGGGGDGGGRRVGVIEVAAAGYSKPCGGVGSGSGAGQGTAEDCDLNDSGYT